jgi:hypothetical protein
MRIAAEISAAAALVGTGTSDQTSGDALLPPIPGLPKGGVELLTSFKGPRARCFLPLVFIFIKSSHLVPYYHCLERDVDFAEYCKLAIKKLTLFLVDL